MMMMMMMMMQFTALLFSDYRKWCSLLHISYHYKTQVIVHLYPKLNYRI